MLKGKTVVLGVTGSIAAYKIANLASMLKKLNANVTVMMTQNATNFINYASVHEKYRAEGRIWKGNFWAGIINRCK